MRNRTSLLLVTSLVLTLAIPSSAFASPKQSVSFAGIQLAHAFSGGKSVTTHEWVEEGSTLENWDHLLAFREYRKEKKPAVVVRKYIKQLGIEEMQIFQKDGNPEDLTLLFVLTAPNGSYTEFNVHRFTKEDGTVRSYQFASRSYQRPYHVLMEEIEESRNAWLEELSQLSAAEVLE